MLKYIFPCDFGDFWNLCYGHLMASTGYSSQSWFEAALNLLISLSFKHFSKVSVGSVKPVRSYLSRSVFIFNCLINNLNFFAGVGLLVIKACGLPVCGVPLWGKCLHFHHCEKSQVMKWPQKPDTLEYEWSDMLGGIIPPKLMSK
jgi:hypothetical protein